jgi:protein-tyrosine-phosphatase
VARFHLAAAEAALGKLAEAAADYQKVIDGAGTSIYVASAGLAHGEPDPFAAEVMAEIGVPIGGHRPHTLDELGDDSFDLVVALSEEARDRAAQWARNKSLDLDYWPIFDPTAAEGTREQRLAAYRQVRDDLDARIRERFLGQGRR